MRRSSLRAVVAAAIRSLGGGALLGGALLAGALLAVLAGAGGCAADVPVGVANPTSASSPAAGPDVADLSGLADLKVGASLADLVAAGVVVRTEASCRGVAHATRPQVSPVFDGDRLVLIWLDPPLHTPEGVRVGSPLDAARSAYPDALVLDRPPGSTQYQGLLVVGGDRAYLLLHDGDRVQKLVVGFERYARLLFDQGFGTC